MKYIIPLLFLTFIIVSCSSSVNTTDLAPEDRLNYAKTLFDDEDYLEAIKEYEALILQYPGSSIVDDAQYYLGMCRYNRGEYILAAFEFSKLIKGMPSSSFLPDAQFMLADSYYMLSPNWNLEQQYTKKAIEEFQAFIDFFPLNEKVAEAERKIKEMNNKLAKKEYEAARIYEKLEYYKAASKYYDNVIEIYHDTEFAPLAMYDKIKLLVSRESYDDALREARKFVERYPDSPYFNEVSKIKDDYEELLRAKGNG